MAWGDRYPSSLWTAPGARASPCNPPASSPRGRGRGRPPASATPPPMQQPAAARAPLMKSTRSGRCVEGSETNLTPDPRNATFSRLLNISREPTVLLDSCAGLGRNQGRGCRWRACRVCVRLRCQGERVHAPVRAWAGATGAGRGAGGGGLMGSARLLHWWWPSPHAERGCRKRGGGGDRKQTESVTAPLPPARSTHGATLHLHACVLQICSAYCSCCVCARARARVRPRGCMPVHAQRTVRPDLMIPLVLPPGC